MQKKVLTEQALYYGDVAMPKDWDIDRDKLSGDILQSIIQNKDFTFSRTFDMLNTYMRDHINLDYGFTLINKETWGNIYKPQETTIPLLNIDPVDLRNSPDYTLLYGVKVKDCMVRIHYEDNQIFWPKKPYASWVKNTTTAGWKSPIGDAPELTDEQKAQNEADTHRWHYTWNEANTTWDLTDSKA